MKRLVGELDMFGDTRVTAHDRFSPVFIQRFTPDGGAPWSHGAKTLLWASLAIAGWAAVIVSGDFVWSAF